MPTPVQSCLEQFELPAIGREDTLKISVSRLTDHSSEVEDVPVLFVLDADIEFGMAAEIARFRGSTGRLPTAMVVGVGYGVPYAEFKRLRARDFTPSLQPDAATSPHPALVAEESGGADAFLSFLADRLLPEIARRYPEASRTNRILFGHSLAGLFSAYALLKRPDLFTTYVIASPSLWWDDFSVLSKIGEFATSVEALECRPKVLVSVGEREEDPPSKVPPLVNASLEEVRAVVAKSRMIAAAAEFAAALRSAGLNEVEFATIPREEHLTMVPAAMMLGLNFAVPEGA